MTKEEFISIWLPDLDKDEYTRCLEELDEVKDYTQASIYYSGYNRGHKDARKDIHISNVHFSWSLFKNKKK